MFRLILKWHNFDLLTKDIDWLLRIFQISMALRNINDCLNWSRIIFTIIMSLSDKLFFQITDGAVGGCYWFWLLLDFCKHMICFWNLIILSGSLFERGQWLFQLANVSFFVFVEIFPSSLNLDLSDLYQWFIITFLLN
jgi:hypothetical protein